VNFEVGDLHQEIEIEKNLKGSSKNYCAILLILPV